LPLNDIMLLSDPVHSQLPFVAVQEVHRQCR
jgi:hypothetical protein